MKILTSQVLKTQVLIRGVLLYRVLPSQLSCYSNVSRGRASGIIASLQYKSIGVHFHDETQRYRRH